MGFLSLPLQLHRAMRRRQRDAAPPKAAEAGGAPAPARPRRQRDTPEGPPRPPGAPVLMPARGQRLGKGAPGGPGPSLGPGAGVKGRGRTPFPAPFPPGPGEVAPAACVAPGQRHQELPLSQARPGLTEGIPLLSANRWAPGLSCGEQGAHKLLTIRMPQRRCLRVPSVRKRTDPGRSSKSRHEQQKGKPKDYGLYTGCCRWSKKLLGAAAGGDTCRGPAETPGCAWLL